MKSCILALILALLTTVAQAEDINPPKRLKEALKLGMISSVINTVTFKNADVVLKDKICALNDKERTRYSPPAVNQDLFEEIQYFVKVQERYVRPLMADQTASAGEVCRERCQRGKELQNCLLDMSERRKALIELTGLNGFSCFKRYEDGYTYLNADLTEQSLEPAEKSFSKKLDSLDRAKRFECGVKISETEKRRCLREITKKENSLIAHCPQDAAMAARSSSTRLGTGGASNSTSSGSK